MTIGALEAMDRGHVVAMDSDTESVVSSGLRSHHSFEDVLEMDLEATPVGEVGSELDDGVSAVGRATFFGGTSFRGSRVA